MEINLVVKSINKNGGSVWTYSITRFKTLHVLIKIEAKRLSTSSFFCWHRGVSAWSLNAQLRSLFWLRSLFGCQYFGLQNSKIRTVLCLPFIFLVWPKVDACAHASLLKSRNEKMPSFVVRLQLLWDVNCFSAFCDNWTQFFDNKNRRKLSEFTAINLDFLD